MKAGRPKGSGVTEEIKRHIVDQIATGRFLRNIIKEDEIGFTQRTINIELIKDPIFYSNYARARDIAQELRIAEVEGIIKGEDEWADLDFEVRKEVANNRRWEAIKLARHRYGEKALVDVNATMQVEAKVIDAKILDVTQREAIRQALLAAKQSGQNDE